MNTEHRGIFPDSCSLGVDLIGLFGALLGFAEGVALVYAASAGTAPMFLRVIVGVAGVAWAGAFVFLLIAWSKGWLE